MTDVLSLVEGGGPVLRWLIVRFDSISDVDYSAAKMLLYLINRFQVRHATLIFSDVDAQLRLRLQRYGVVGALGSDKVFGDCISAVREFERLLHKAEVGQDEANDVPATTGPKSVVSPNA